MAREIYNDRTDLPWYEQRLPMEGRYTFLPLRDTQPGLEGSVFNQREWALPGLLAEVVNAVTAPGRSLLGSDFNAQEEAANMALNIGGGGLLASRAMPSTGGGVDLGMFAGRNARTADLDALKRFNEMQAAKTPVSQSYKETGWMQGAEGKPRFEISDEGSLVLRDSLGVLDKPSVTQWSDFVKLPEVLIHPELYKAYPELRDYNVGVYDNMNAVGGFDPTNKAFLIGGEYRQSFKDDPQSLRNLLLHEIQHGIQYMEGFEKGGNTEIAPKVLAKQAKADLSRFDPSLNVTYNTAAKARADAGDGLYLYQLDKIANSENIKPSSIRNYSEWYKYSGDINRQFGSPPKKAGAERDEWYRNAANFLKNKAIEENPSLANYRNINEKELNAIYKSSDRKIKKILPEYQEMQKTVEKYKKMGELSDYKLYERLAGEAEARLTEARKNMTQQQLRENFPYHMLDVPYEEFLFRSLLD